MNFRMYLTEEILEENEKKFISRALLHVYITTPLLTLAPGT